MGATMPPQPKVHITNINDDMSGMLNGELKL